MSFVISLDTVVGHERLKQFKAKCPVETQTFLASLHERGGTYGCWKSHMDVLKIAAIQNLDWVLVFEDDAIPTNEFNKSIFDKILNSLSLLPKEWDLVGLGGIASCWSTAAQKYSDLFYQVPFFELHSYIASRKFMNSICDMEYDGQVDYAFARRAFSTSFLCDPELFVQDDLLGSHNKLQSTILPFRSRFKAVNRFLMRGNVRIRDIVLLMISTSFVCGNNNKLFLACLVFILAVFNSVLDPSFAFRSRVPRFKNTALTCKITNFVSVRMKK